MADEHFYHVIIESTKIILELIQEHQIDVHLNRLMEDDDTMLFAFQRQLSDGSNVYAQSIVRPQPYLAVDLQELFIDFFQILKYTI